MKQCEILFLYYLKDYIKREGRNKCFIDCYKAMKIVCLLNQIINKNH